MRIVELRESCILTTTARLSWRSVCRSSLHRGVLGRTLPAVLRQLDSYSYALSTSHSSQRRAVPDSAATGAATGYMTLEKAFRYEAEVKKSRFVVTAWPIASTSQVIHMCTCVSRLPADAALLHCAYALTCMSGPRQRSVPQCEHGLQDPSGADLSTSHACQRQVSACAPMPCT
jgi:hypothetical protein